MFDDYNDIYLFMSTTFFDFQKSSSQTGLANWSCTYETDSQATHQIHLLKSTLIHPTHLKNNYYLHLITI